MAYLGKKPEDTFRGLAFKDTFTGDGSTVTFDITNAAPAGGDFDIEVFVENVRQEPGAGKAYTLGADGSGNIKRITFSTAPESAAEIYVINPGKPYEILTIADNSVTTAKILNSAVTTDKIADGSITADKIANGTIVAAEIADGTITAIKLASTLDLSSKSVTLANSEISNAELTNSSITINGTSISLGGSGTIVAGTSWQAVKTSGFTAVAGEGYFCNTTSAAFTATLPASATIGNEISFIDYAGTFDTNNLTIGRNSHNIQGVAEDLTVSTERAGFTLVYVDATQGWLLKDK
jgi:hypothetical protein